MAFKGLKILLAMGLILWVTVMATAQEDAENEIDDSGDDDESEEEDAANDEDQDDEANDNGEDQDDEADDENEGADDEANDDADDNTDENESDDSEVVTRFKRQAVGCRRGGKTYSYQCAQYKQRSLSCLRWQGCINARCRTIKASEIRSFCP